jgi:hypothetical protein
MYYRQVNLFNVDTLAHKWCGLEAPVKQIRCNMYTLGQKVANVLQITSDILPAVYANRLTSDSPVLRLSSRIISPAGQHLLDK